MGPLAVVVIGTVAVSLPVVKVFGLTTQVVYVAAGGKEHVKLTWEEKPFCGVTVIASVNVAGWPAETVSVVVPKETMEKSGEGGSTVSVKLPVEAV